MALARLTILLISFVMMAPAASAANWGDDQAQADTCETGLEHLIAERFREAVEVMFFQSQPWPSEKIRQLPGFDKTASEFHDKLRMAYPELQKAFEFTKVRERVPLPRQAIGERIVHLEEWTFENGKKLYVGCVRWPEGASAGTWHFWHLELKLGASEAEVMEHLKTKVRSATWGDDAAQAEHCKMVLERIAAERMAQAVEAMALEAQPWDVEAARQSPDWKQQADQWRATVSSYYQAKRTEIGAAYATVKERRTVARPTMGERIAHIEEWDFGNEKKIFAGCVRTPDNNTGKGWHTELYMDVRASNVINYLDAHVRAAGWK